MARLRTCCVLAGVGLLLASATAMGEPAPASADAEPIAHNPKPKLICRTMPTLGTRLAAKRECAPAAEWARMKEEHGRDLQRQQSLSLCGEGCRP